MLVYATHDSFHLTSNHSHPALTSDVPQTAMAPPGETEDIYTSLQHALGYLQQVTEQVGLRTLTIRGGFSNFLEQLRVVSPETANEVARKVNEIAMAVTSTAIEYDLYDPAQDAPPARTEPTPSLVAGPLQPRPRHAPAFPPGLGYDTPETQAHILRGDKVVGRGFGFDPPLIPPGTLPVPNFVPTKPRAMMTAAQSLADSALLGSLSNRALARRGVGQQVGRSSGVENINNPQRLTPIVEREGEVMAGQPTIAAFESTTNIALPDPRHPTRPIPGVPSAESSAPTKQPQELVRPEPHGAKMTWAKVAATPAPRPTGAGVMASSAHSTQPTQPENAVGPSHPDFTEPPAEQRRVIWVRGCSKNTTLRFISEKIHEGALMSILFDVDPLDSSNPNSRAACVIFHRAASALEFIAANQTLEKETGSCRYGPGYSIEPGLEWPADDEIRTMDAQPQQRRRLTVVGKALFLRVPRQRFKADITRIAGESNVELVWLYNHGNATVVFASVKVARVVHERLTARARSGGPYGGAVVTYTADPCEMTMVLCTQLRAWEQT